MRDSSAVIWVIIFIVIGIFVWRANAPLHNQSKIKPEKTKSEILYQKNEQNEVVVLLSVKYGVPPETVSSVFSDYCHLTGLNCNLEHYLNSNSEEVKSSIGEAIAEIGSKYNITKETVVNLVIDERKMREIDSECVRPNDTDYEDYDEDYGYR